MMNDDINAISSLSSRSILHLVYSFEYQIIAIRILHKWKHNLQINSQPNWILGDIINKLGAEMGFVFRRQFVILSNWIDCNWVSYWEDKTT